MDKSDIREVWVTVPYLYLKDKRLLTAVSHMGFSTVHAIAMEIWLSCCAHTRLGFCMCRRSVSVVSVEWWGWGGGKMSWGREIYLLFKQPTVESSMALSYI